ncbi:MAG: septal ring lytic transglycosylase RlpA family protein [Solirubrobacterales bacterium]
MRRNRRWHRRAAAGAVLLAAAAATTTQVALAASDTNKAARISAAGRTLAFGERFRLGGHVPTDRGLLVRIKFRRSGGAGWTLLRTVHTDRGGSYRTRATARVSGSLRAVPSTGRSSAPQRIRVRSRTSFHVARHHVIAGNPIRLRGRVRPGGRRPVKVVIRGPHGEVTRDATSARGVFRLGWRPGHTGTYRLRAYVGRNGLAAGSASLSRRVTVFRYAMASYYGPGLYGNGVACGGTLLPSTMGVAHKTLPCGTRVTLRYHGRQVTVPVIDRGPYVAGRDYDLTTATKQRLGFPGLGVVLASR